MTDLIKELRELVCIDCDGAQADCGSDGNENPCDGCRIIQNAEREARKILSRHEQEEPLAVLADRKGYVTEFFTDREGSWRVGLFDNGCEQPGAKKLVISPTYAAAEAQARQYLMGLEDK